VSITEHTTPPGEHPNAMAISGLLAIAEYLTEHPETPAMHVFVTGSIGYPFDTENPRERMTQFAESLDCRVTETVSGRRVQIEALVNDRARIELGCDIDALGGRQRTPQYDYEPIVEPCSACGGEPCSEPDGDGNRDVCPKCEGAATQLHQPAVTAADFDRAA
jgi:hypothetical protein